MKYVIWGAGYTGSKLMYNIGAEKIDFFIDSNQMKQGKFLGKDVISPRSVTDWHDLFIYVPFNFYEEIKKYLLGKDLIENKDFVKYESQFLIPHQRATIELEKAIKELNHAKTEWNNSVLLFTSQFFQEIGCLNFVKGMMKNNLIFKIVCEAYWLEQVEINKRLERIESVLIVPSLWEYCSFPANGHLLPDQREIFRKNPYLFEIVKQIQEIFPHADEERSLYLVYYNYSYIVDLINILNPSKIIYSSGVKPNGRLLLHICKEKKIPVLTTHQGIIPGTLSYDIEGEMGESLPAIYSQQFLNLPVDKRDLEEARAIWSYLFKSKLNRKMQPKNFCVNTFSLKINDGPIIFFAAQNDPESHMVPYTEITRKYHSPVFHSSIECGIFLAELCEQNGWNFIFKPHPLYVREEWKNMLPSNTVYIESCNINDLIDFADVTVTILSATSYNALIRYKPVVMLGYTQLRGKGCTYEAFDKDKIEDAIKAALENGFTQEQQDEFLLHMAQCLKYYLYDDLQERPIRYGRPVPKSMDEFYELERLLKSNVPRKD